MQGQDDDERPTGSPGGFWVASDPQGRSMELARYFRIPETETVLDDYNCALRRRGGAGLVLLQGRMHVFDHYVCFSSFVFGFARKVVIPLEKVFSVRKRTHLRFPNSIKIELYNNHGVADQYFFTSFLSREDAFQLITNCVAQSRAVLPMEGEFSLIPAQAPNPCLLAEASEPDMSTRGVSLDRVTQDCDDDYDEEGEAVCDRVWGHVTPGHLPKPHAGSRVLIQAVLEGTPKELFEVMFADNSQFFEDFLESEGNRRINLTSWKRDAELGHVRDIQFVAPIKGAFSHWGVPTTQCHQSHRFRQFEREHLVFESSQTMSDIPYGDCFTVDLRWDVTPLPHRNPAAAVAAEGDGGSPFAGDARPVPQMQVVIAVRVPFNRMCIFKKVIESGTIKGVKEMYTLLIEQLSTALSQLERDKQPVQLGPASTLIQRLSAALDTAGSSSKADPATSSLSRGGSTSNLRHTAGQRGSQNQPSNLKHQSMANSSTSSMRPPSTPGREGRWRRWSIMRLSTASMQHISRRFSSVLPAHQESEAVTIPPDSEPVMDQLPTGQMFMFLLAILILGVQLIVLFVTVRAWRTPKPAQLHGWHRGHGEEGAMDALVTMGKEVWARRAALLKQELGLIRDHMQALQEQLTVAQGHMHA